MSTEYRAIVMCTFPPTEKDPKPKKNLYYAPAFEQFDDDAIVQVETDSGIRVAKVEHYCTMDIHGKDFALVKAACGIDDEADELKRVVTKIRIQDIVYKEDEPEDPVEEKEED